MVGSGSLGPIGGTGTGTGGSTGSLRSCSRRDRLSAGSATGPAALLGTPPRTMTTALMLANDVEISNFPAIRQSGHMNVHLKRRPTGAEELDSDITGCVQCRFAKRGGRDRNKTRKMFLNRKMRLARFSEYCELLPLFPAHGNVSPWQRNVEQSLTWDKPYHYARSRPVSVSSGVPTPGTTFQDPATTLNVSKEVPERSSQFSFNLATGLPGSQSINGRRQLINNAVNTTPSSKLSWVS
ncbi:hypothetical protein R3P38DRAFT_2791502 [Favolaschia claudopus]|uniref:Uncharacterized protein n=1 Tax=Favolaschia claudopus TaxID=2862362 RepID=A0AAW0AHH7_9AGAR